MNDTSARMNDMTTVRLLDALETALAVVLHEELDPGCTGEPPYTETHERAGILAEIVMATPVVQNAIEAEAATGPRDEGLREWLDSPLRDYLDERDRAYLAALAKASER